ncbi:MAG: SIMPL domain-containing protein [Acidimicrobiia bacterium]
MATALVAVLVATTAAPASARTGRADRRGTVPVATEPTEVTRTVVATGIARVQGVPDVLTMTLGVTSRGRTVGEALDRNTTAASKVMEVLTDGGVDKKDIQTSSFSIGPTYDDHSGDVNGYQVSNQVTVQLRELAKAGSLIDQAAGAGGDDVVMQGVSFGFDDASDLVAQARAEAVKRARSQAEQLARAAGVELGEVRTITESSMDVGPVIVPEAATKSQADSVPIAPGSEEVAVQVSIVYAIH